MAEILSGPPSRGKEFRRHPELSDACQKAREWAERYESLEDAWKACERGDWMIWWLNRVLPDGGRDDKRHQIACDCVERVLRFVLEGENRPRRAIETKRRWCAGEATDDELRESRAAVADASASSAMAAAAAIAANVTAAVAVAVSVDALRLERKAQADIVRKYFPEFPRR